MADIFLSYNHQDRARIRPLVERLQREGWAVWWDRAIEPVRPGYDPRFLGTDHELAMPDITGTGVVLRYLHFTVVMNPARRRAVPARRGAADVSAAAAQVDRAHHLGFLQEVTR